MWLLICTVMIFLSEVGFVMKESGTINVTRNSAMLLKTVLVIGTSSFTFFSVGFGLSYNARGGVLGQDHFFGVGYLYSDYSLFIFYLAMCVLTATIATGSIAERTHIDTYVFFSFVMSGFIFPIGIAWCWNNGWLQELGFLDYGGASVIHLMAGIAGFIGTYLIGPRMHLFS